MNSANRILPFVFSALLAAVSLTATAATADQLADALHARGLSSEKRNDTMAAIASYQLVLRAKPGHSGAMERMSALKSKMPPLDSMIIPSITLSGATLEEALEFMRVKSQVADAFGYGADIIQVAPGNGRNISLDLRRVPLKDALRYITELSGMKYTWENRRVVVRALNAKPAPLESPADGPGKKELPKIQFQGAKLGEVLAFIKSTTAIDFAVFDDAGKALDVSTIPATLTLQVRDITLAELLRYLSEITGRSIKIEGDRIAVRPLPPVLTAGATLKWTSKAGKTIEAVFVKIDGGSVVLKQAGKEIKIDINQLDERSANQARQMAAVGDFGK